MLSRRALFGGGLLSGVAVTSAAAETIVQNDREGLREIAQALQGLRNVLTEGNDAAELPSRLIDRIREQMAQFLRAHGKFPDYCDVGSDVFYSVYDWHVKQGQELSIGRLPPPDNRYAIQFMFTRMVLRPETESSFLGYPYDLR